MKTIRLLLLVVLVAFCPARAYALEGWWDWLDALSGPGPYVGYRCLWSFVLCPGMPKTGDSTNCWREEWSTATSVFRH